MILLVEASAQIVFEFLAVLVFALLATLLTKRLKKPAVIGLILAGALIGPNMLLMVSQSEFITIFAEIGAVLLFFYIGLEFDFSKLLSLGVKAFLLAAVKMAFVFVLVHEAALLFGLNELDALIVGIMLSITSTTILVKMLEQKGFAERPEVKLLVAELIIEDIIAIAAITFFSSLGAADFTVDKTLISISTSIVILGAVYLILSRIFKTVAGSILGRDKETVLFFSLTTALFLSFVALSLGLSAAIGAFMAGMLVSSVNAEKAAKNALEPLSLTFSAIFFISMGMLANPALILKNLPLFAAIILVQTAACWAGVFIGTRLTGLDGREAAFSSSSFLVLGEFSMLIAITAAPLATIDIVGLASLSILVSAVISSKLLDNSDKIHGFLAGIAPKRQAEAFCRICSFTAQLLSMFDSDSLLHNVLEREVAKKRNVLWVLLLASGGVLAAHFVFSGTTLSVGGETISVFSITLGILAAVVVYSVVNVMSSVSKIMMVIEDTLPFSNEKNVARRAKKKFAAAAGIAIIAFSVPMMISALRLPDALKNVHFAFLALAALVAWFGIKDMSELTTSASKSLKGRLSRQIGLLKTAVKGTEPKKPRKIYD